MANPIIVIIAIAVVAMIIYAGYTFFSGKAPLPQATSSVPIPTTQQGASNSFTNNSISSNSLPGNFIANSIVIYEDDFNGINAQHYFSPSTFNVITGSHVSLFVVNNGIVPHNLKIFGTGFNISIPNDILPGQNAILNFTAPMYGNYSMISTHPGDQALGFNGIMIVLNAT